MHKVLDKLTLGQVLAMVLLNATPVFGVLFFGWSVFDIVFLYWMENVVIGVFTIGRMVVRRYAGPQDLIFPFMAVFFFFHYGMFCWGHGTFVVSLFGDFPADVALHEAVRLQLDNLVVLIGIVALVVLHAVAPPSEATAPAQQAAGNSRPRGAVRGLMVAPYRRILVLHLAIMGSGFVLGTLQEPLAGLLLLVLMKTAFDLYHAGRDGTAENDEGSAELDPALMAEIALEFAEPVLTVNGREKRFDSFTELYQSRELRALRGVLRMTGSSAKLRAFEAYLQARMEAERGSP